jgi:FixJ family two-component response regulator
MIAVVDDEQTMLKAIDRLLTANGFATQIFASAEAFLDSHSAKDATCLVLDIQLSGMSGIELRRRLKAVRSKLPVIFITAVDDEVLHREAMEVGCVACLRKPFSADSLIGAIEKATG